MELFKAVEIKQITGVKKSELIHWCNTGVIVPFRDGKGRGRVRYFDRKNLLEIFVLRELHRFGISSRVLKEALRDLNIAAHMKRIKRTVQKRRAFYLVLTLKKVGGGDEIKTEFTKNLGLLQAESSAVAINLSILFEAVPAIISGDGA
jgi:DNA-binding transcriptional MerR regulator